MIAGNIITKENIIKLLNMLITTKEDLIFFGNLFENKSKTEQEKIIYLLYNEYINLNDVQSDSFDITTYDNIFNAEYGNMKKEYVRDYIKTLSFDSYKDKDNIKDQMNIVDSMLTNDEISLLTSLGITENYTYSLIRIETPLSIEKSVIENDSSLLKKFSNVLNKKNYTNQDYSLLTSVFKKIALGTINY